LLLNLIILAWRWLTIESTHVAKTVYVDTSVLNNDCLSKTVLKVYLSSANTTQPVPVATRSKASVCACWDCGFESRRGHGCLSVVSVVCCQVKVSATSWSLVQRSPTDCGASLCVRSRNLVNEEALAHWGLSRKKKDSSNAARGMDICLVWVLFVVR